MKRVIVHIDSLALHGFRREDRQAIAAGLEETLAAMLGDPAAVAQLGGAREVSHLRAGSARVRHDAAPHSIGASVAHRIHRGLQR